MVFQLMISFQKMSTWKKKDKVVYPKVDDFVQLTNVKSQGCLLLKTDLRRFYHQLNICPSSMHLISFMWKQRLFCDTVLSMGCRSSTYIAQYL